MPGLNTAGPIQFHLAILLSLFILFSCAKGKEESEEEDRSTPYVASISPTDDATGVATTSKITITFSKPVPPSDVTVDGDGQCTKNVQVSSDSFSTCLPLSSDGGDSSSKVFVLTPNTYNIKIPSGTTYTINVSKNIKDYYDKKMDADKTSSFTTETRCSSGCSWSQVTTDGKLTGRSGHSGLVFNKKMWLFGGYDNNTQYFRDVMSSPDNTSLISGQWDNITNDNISESFSARDDHVSLRFNGSMWVIGGKNSNNSNGINDVWSSSTGKSWDNQTLTNAFSTRLGHAGVVFDKKIWILGGMAESSYLNDVWSSIDGKKWGKVDNVTPMWSGRYGHTAVVYKNKIWVMGGNDNESGDSNEVWSSEDGKSWEQSNSNVTWAGMKDHSAQVFDGKIWILGGNDNGSTQQKYYTFDGSNWSSAMVPGWPQRSSLVSFEFDNYLWVVGGDKGTATGRYLSDVWKYGK